MSRRSYSKDPVEYLNQLEKSILVFKEDMSLYRIMIDPRMRRDKQECLSDYLSIIDSQVISTQNSGIGCEYVEGDLSRDPKFLEIKTGWEEIKKEFEQIEEPFFGVIGSGLKAVTDEVLAERKKRRYGGEGGEPNASSETEGYNLSVVAENGDESDDETETVRDYSGIPLRVQFWRLPCDKKDGTGREELSDGIEKEIADLVGCVPEFHAKPGRGNGEG